MGRRWRAMLKRKDRLRPVKMMLGLALVSIMSITSACSHKGAEVVTGYGVTYEDGKLLLVEPINADDPEGRREAVWIDNLGKKHVGGLLRVTLGDSADSYPAQSSSRKTEQLKQLKGEKEMVRACLDYAREKWQNEFLVINAVNYMEDRSEWEVQVGLLFEDRLMTLLVDQDKEIVEMTSDRE